VQEEGGWREEGYQVIHLHELLEKLRIESRHTGVSFYGLQECGDAGMWQCHFFGPWKHEFAGVSFCRLWGCGKVGLRKKFMRVFTPCPYMVYLGNI
jgi:hypothetical protein